MTKMLILMTAFTVAYIATGAIVLGAAALIAYALERRHR